MNTTFTPERSDAIRAGLVDRVSADAPRRSRTLWGISLVLVGALAGAGASVGAFAATGAFTAASPAFPSGQPSPQLGDPVPAPPGVTPGAPIISLLGEPISQTIASDGEIALASRPDAATHARVTITCLTPGGLTWGTDTAGNNPSGSWGECDPNSPVGTAWYDFPLDDTVDTMFFTPSGGLTAVASLQYLNYVPTQLGVNARGETFGVVSEYGSPDLISAIGTAPDGSEVLGYVRASDLGRTSPDHPGVPTTPEEALRWQEGTQRDYPDGWDIPIFEPDGVTQIGVMRIGG